MRLEEAASRRRAAAADHGILATGNADRGVDLVPVCFVLEGDVVAVPVDRVKPKGPGRLQRARNLDADPRGTLLCERWDAEDWSRLWWVRLRLRSEQQEQATSDALARALVAKYPQYAAAPFEEILAFRVLEIAGWAASGADD